VVVVGRNAGRLRSPKRRVVKRSHMFSSVVVVVAKWLAWHQSILTKNAKCGINLDNV
jgi:hypothetical protein